MKKLFFIVILFAGCTSQPSSVDTAAADKIYFDAMQASDKRQHELLMQIQLERIIQNCAADPTYIPTAEEKEIIVQADTTFIK